MDDVDRDGGKVAAGLSPGEHVAGYVVGERLGVGGFGEVYAAKHAVIGKEVAIKILHRRYSHDADAVARFVAEAQAVNRIQHAGIVDIFDFGRLPDGREFCVMERIRGRTLRQLLTERGRLPLAEAVPILRAVAEAIDAAHGAGVAHRDLKPDNVFVVDGSADASTSGSSRGPIVKLIDFGLAKLTDGGAAAAATVTRTGAMAGTPLYMSPEQCRGRNVDARTDLYSFGALAYHVLTGSPPFAGDALELALHHINDPPEPPSSRCNDLSLAVDRAVLALLDKDPALRPTPLAIAVEAMAGGAQLRTRRHPLRWIVAIGGAAIVGGVALKICAPDRTIAADAGLVAPRFVERRLPVVQENVFLWPTLSPDGKTVVYFDRVWYELRVDDGHREPIDPPPGCVVPGLVSPMAQDRFLAVPWAPPGAGVPAGAHGRDPCPDPTGPWVWLRGADRTWQGLKVAGAEPYASPDGKRLAIKRGGMVVVRDLETGHETEIASAASLEAGIRWSPDGDRLVWARRSQDGLARLEIASVSVPSVRSIPAALLDPATLITGRQTAGSSGPAAFRDSDHLIYCASDAAGRRVEERTLGTGQVVTLRGLDADVIGCAVSASIDGRVMIVAYHNVGGGSVLALDDPSAEWRATVGDRFDVPVEVTSQGRLLIAKPRSDDRQPIELVTTALDGSQPVPVASCEGSIDVVRWGLELGLVDVRTEGVDEVFRLRSLGTCNPIAEWRVPALSGWGRLRCGARFCVVARQEGSKAYVWQLRIGQSRGSELAQGDIPANIFGFGPLDLAISLDGKYVVMVGRDNLIRVISVDGKPTDQGAPVRELDLGLWYFQHVVWSNDDQHFYASACCPTTIDEAANGRNGHVVRVIRADLDGHSENISAHDKDFTYTRIAITALSPDGKTLLGFTTRVEPDVMLLDFER